jgi:hypothetical protein
MAIFPSLFILQLPVAYFDIIVFTLSLFLEKDSQTSFDSHRGSYPKQHRQKLD